jgi:hypothetical protein
MHNGGTYFNIYVDLKCGLKIDILGLIHEDDSQGAFQFYLATTVAIMKLDVSMPWDRIVYFNP